MQKLSKLIQSMEKKEQISIEELNINVGTINEINLKLKEYLDEVEVRFISLSGGKNAPCNTVYVGLYQGFIVLGGVIYLRTSTMSRVCWTRAKPVSQ